MRFKRDSAVFGAKMIQYAILGVIDSKHPKFDISVSQVEGLE
jgi:hypothetical protein